MTTSLSEFYHVRNDDTVTLKITIGYGQEGVSSVSLGLEQLVCGQSNTVEIILPYKGKELSGKTLFCSTAVADVRHETNQTSVTYELTGGIDSFKRPLEEGVEHEKDVKFYTATFRFYV